MLQTSETTDAMNAPMDESTISNSYQISSSTPEQVRTSSRAMHARKGSKSSGSNSRSSSSSSGRPPLPKGATSHRGPGSLELPAAAPSDITPVHSQPGTLQSVVAEKTQSQRV